MRIPGRVPGLEREPREELDARFELTEGPAERPAFLLVGACDRRGIVDAPVGGRRPARPVRASAAALQR
jgi:hypothetical protein